VKYTGNPMRLTVEQNLVFRWVSGADAVDLYRDLSALDLAEAGASMISDLVSCPGTDTCKLGISASRGLTGELRRRLTVLEDKLDPAVQRLHVKTSGCFNSCGQHHVADVGFLGVSRQVGGRKVPHFNVTLGGQWTENAKSYGLVVGAVPSKNAPDALLGITQHYLDNREGEETFQQFIARVGKRGFREVLKPYQAVPAYDVDPSYYRDWGDPREYGIGDIGVGECAGEIVPFVEFGLQAAEQQLFDAQDLQHEGRSAEAAQKAFRAMLTAAQALVRHTGAQIRDEVDDIVEGFRKHLHETQIFHDPFVKDKFAQFFFRIHTEPRLATADETLAHRTLDEAALFLDASHACYQRMTQAASAVSAAE
jgi:sulfite reductase (ferredoxin)